jgi:hypothetical protein
LKNNIFVKTPIMKKFFKIIKYTFVSILAIFALAFLYIFISNKVFIGTVNKKNIDYLNLRRVRITDSIPGTLFDDNFYHSDIFLLGEIHGYADNQKLDKELFLYLNKKLNIRYYIAEMDSTNADKLNSFLSKSTKDETLLKDIVTAIRKRIPQQSSVELYHKWIEIYDYNQRLADSAKIKVIGIDKSFVDNKSTVSRDSAMVLNLEDYVKKHHLEDEKFYGLFGFFHVLQKGKDTASPFAARLKNKGRKITSFVSYTLDSEMYLPKNPQFPTPPDEKVNWINADGPLMLVKGINDLKELSQANSISLFKLNAQGSPYKTSQDLITVKSRMFGENIIPSDKTYTTDYFQYVFLLRNSKALRKLD